MNEQLMSSEEGGVDGDEEVIMVKSLPWGSNQENEFLKRIDSKITVEQSAQAQRQAECLLNWHRHAGNQVINPLTIQHGCSRTFLN